MEQMEQMEDLSKPRTWSWLLLFTTSGTLICCAIPITLVSLGLGAAVASMASSVPWLITLSMYKGWMFTVSGGLIALSAWAVYRPGRSCPTDPELAAACERADRWNRRFIWFSAIMWCVGFTAAFVLPVLVFV
jgi:mercuric ion transport protein